MDDELTPQPERLDPGLLRGFDGSWPWMMVVVAAVYVAVGVMVVGARVSASGEPESM